MNFCDTIKIEFDSKVFLGPLLQALSLKLKSNIVNKNFNSIGFR